MQSIRRLILLFLSGLLIVLILISCGEDEVTLGDRGGSYAGYVYDSVTSLPIDSTLLSHGDTVEVVRYSDSTGYFRHVSFGGTLTLFVRKGGYVTQFTTIDLSENRSDLVFNLVPTK